MTGMVTRIRRGARVHLYVREWLDFRDVSPEALANRLGVARESVYRWLREPKRIDPLKQAQIASALDIEPIDLWRLPSTRPSLDAMVKEADDQTFDLAVEMVKRIAKGGG